MFFMTPVIFRQITGVILLNKEEIKLKLLSEREISYRKLKNKYSELFDLLNISSNDNIQNILYDWCYDDHQTNHKCENPLCDKLSRFNGFKTGYNNTCGSYSCSSKVLPRGRQSKEYLDGVSERRKQEAKQIEFDKMNGTHICDHGCGRTAKFYSSQNKTWRCEE